MGIYPLIDKNYIFIVVSNEWNNSAMIQDLFHCCGIKSPGDRPNDSYACPVSVTSDFANQTQLLGCVPTIQKYTMYWTIAMCVLAAICLLGVRRKQKTVNGGGGGGGVIVYN